MSEYQLQIKQVVDYPRCRIYRQFVQSLIEDRNIRANSGSGLFYYTVLCSYANFRTSYRRIDGISYTVYPGEWICSLKELSGWFRTRFQHQTLSVLEDLQDRHLISYLTLNRGKVIKYKIRDWKEHNTVLDYNCPCQKDSGFFFLPVSVAAELISSGRCSEMDVMLDLWVSAVYNDAQVQGSELGPVVYLRNGTGCPLVTYTDLGARWGLSKATAGRTLKKLAQMDYISLMAFPGRTGSIIYLKSYLSTMFQISDVLIDKEEIAMALNIHISLPDAEESDTVEVSPMEALSTETPSMEDAPVKNVPTEESPVCGQDSSVSKNCPSVSKAHMDIIIRKLAQILEPQGIPCFRCPRSIYKLSPLWNDWEGKYSTRPGEIPGHRFRLSVLCGSGRTVRTFELTLSPITEKNGGNEHEE